MIDLTAENGFLSTVLGDSTICKWKSIDCHLVAGTELLYPIFKNFVLMILQSRDNSVSF